MSFDIKKEAQNAVALADALDAQGNASGSRGLAAACASAAIAARNLAQELSRLDVALEPARKAAAAKKK